MATQIQSRRDTAANWTSANPILANGEIGIETDTKKMKVGDGIATWTALAYFIGGAGSGDMLKSTYDTNADGIVDNAEKVAGKTPTVTPTPDEIPIAHTDGTLDVGWMPTGVMKKSVYDTDASGTVDNAEKVAGKVPTATPTASAIPIADASGTLNAWVTGSGGGGATLTPILYADALTAIANNTLVAGGTYNILDRNVVLTAISTNQFSTQGIYLYTAGKYAWALINIDIAYGVSSASVDTLTVDGVSIISAPVNAVISTYSVTRNSNVPQKISLSYNDSNYRTAEAVANAVNAYGSYKAYAINTLVCIEAKTFGTTQHALSMSGTNITASSGTIRYGEAALTDPLTYDCNYDITTDRLYRLYDPVHCNEVSQDDRFQDLNGNTILEFNWNEPSIYNNTIKNSIVSRNFVVPNGTTDYIYNNTFTNARFSPNYVNSGEISNNKVLFGEIAYNTVSGGKIVGNTLTSNSGGAIYPANPTKINWNRVLTSGEISGNRLWTGAWIIYNSFETSSVLHSNILSFYVEYSWNSHTGSTSRIFDNHFYGREQVSGNTFTDTLFYNIDLHDDAGILNNNFSACLLDDVSMHNSWFLRNTWNQICLGQGTMANQWVDNMSLSGSIKYTYLMTGAATSTSLTIYHIMNANATTYNGAVGVVPMWQLRGGAYVYEVRIVSNNVTADAGTQIKIGLQGQDDAAVLPLTNVSTMSNTTEIVANPTMLKAATNNTPLILTVVGGNITGGQIKIMLKSGM